MAVIVTLTGSATDDGLPDPPGTLTYQWSKISGPGGVVFADAADPTTTATIDEAGTYVLRLTASDSALFHTDEMTVILTVPFTPPLPGDPEYYYGDMAAYVMWDGAHVIRTMNILASPPVWALIDTGITGNIYDGQYVFVDADTVGMWLMTSTAIWWCADILAATPSWTAVLPIATVQAAEATPETGVVGFKTMFNYASEVGYLCVATGPVADSSNNPNYQHAYFWHTHDFGQTWTTIDMNGFLRTEGGSTHGYFHSGLYAMNIYRSAPGTIWCIRETPSISSNVDIRVFYSSDLGHTWSMGAILSGNDGDIPFGTPSLLNPFPDATDPSYAVSGASAATNVGTLQKSIDGWVTKADIAVPTGYSGIYHLWRPNKRTFDNLHAIAWWHHTAENQAHLLQTEDGGLTWTLLYDPGLAPASIPNIPGTSVASARHNTPNGWPPAEVGGLADVMPRWGMYDRVADTFTLGDLSITAKTEVHIHLSGVSSDVTIHSDLMFGPPANAKRVVIFGVWSQENARSGGVTTISEPQLGNTAGVTRVDDFTGNQHSTIGTWSGTFTATYTKTSVPSVWAGNKDSFISSPPSSTADAVRFTASGTASGVGAGESADIDVEMFLRVMEIELDDGTIYTRGDGQWVVIRANGALAAPVVQMTFDNFATLVDKEGNLSSILGSGWTNGPADGFALPKVG